MTIAFVLPALAALIAAAVLGAAPHRLRPPTATRLLTAAIVASSVAAVAVLTAIGLSYLSQLPRLARAMGWCHAVTSHHDRVPPELGIPALGLLAAMVFASARAVRRRRRATLGYEADNDIEILPVDQPLAYAMPGRPGHVVVSVGMIRRLDADERRVLFAHEQAHLTHHHHRFLEVAEVAAAVLPVLRPLLTQLRFATERWADETAAATVGDRHLVARAIARAALAGQPASASMAFARTGVVARVDALLDVRCSPRWYGRSVVVLFAAVLAASATASGIQLHHLVELIDHVCS